MEQHAVVFFLTPYPTLCIFVSVDLDYNKIYEATRTKIAELENERAELDREIARRRQFLLNLGRMLGKEGPSPSKGKYQGAGMKAACALVLKAAYEPLTPTDVHERLKEAQFAFAKRANPVSIVGITLRRMAQAGEVINHGSERRPSYVWKWPAGTENARNA